MLNSKTLKRKVKSRFMIYVDFESKNGNKNPNESYTNIKNMLLVVMVIN